MGVLPERAELCLSFIMLKLRLDELVGPELVRAFQEQWSASSDAAFAQATDALRLLTAPQDEAERFAAGVVLSLVGPEPDAFAWLEAMCTGSFDLNGPVAVTINRVKQSPAQAIRRQQERVEALAAKDGHVPDRAAVENAYKDALRLLVAVSLLTRMRAGVAAKAALGAGWAAMAGITEHCSTDEKRALFWLGNDASFQATIADAVKGVISRVTCVYPTSGTPTRADVKGRLPVDVDPYAFFRTQGDKIEVQLRKRHRAPATVPDFIRAPKRDEIPKALYRAELLMPSLSDRISGEGQPSVAFALALRSRDRRLARLQYRRSGDNGLTFADWNVQTAIWRYIRAGGFFPVALPPTLVSYFEEDLAYCYHQFGEAWKGYSVWSRARFLQFTPDPTKVLRLSI